MTIDVTPECASRAEAWLRCRSACIEQRHLQFGKHCRLDVGSLLSRLARQVRPQECSPAKRSMPPYSAANCRHVPGPATLGGFVASVRAGAAPRHECEWIATLPDLTGVVVSDFGNAPSTVGIEKAVSIVQSRAYLEHRARRLLLPFTEDAGTWRLVTIDFGAEARRHGCEFLMCFASRTMPSMPSTTNPSVQIGFALPTPRAADPVFVLRVVAAVGFSSQRRPRRSPGCAPGCAE